MKISKIRQQREKGKRKKEKRYVLIVIAAILVLVIGCVGWAFGTGKIQITKQLAENTYAVASANYPEYTGENEDMNYEENYPDNYNEFVNTTMRTMLTQEADENQVYSPLNIYLALALLAEVTDGNSRAQVLEVMGTDDMDSLRTQATALWNGNYRDDEDVTSILASSLWLNEDISYHEDTVNTLANQYYASVYQGQMGSQEYTDAFISWINHQTGDLLQEQSSKLELRSDTVAALVTTIYYQVHWSDEFSEEMTETNTFHGANGDTECDFMYQTIDQTTYFAGEHFGAVYKYFRGGGGMWLILPDKDSSVSELLAGEELYELLDTSDSIALYNTSDWENSRNVKLNLFMPKFDIVSNWDLQKTLETLGITDVFDSNKADVSALTDSDAYLSEITHAARIVVDEEGVTAAAYTEMMLTESALLQEMEEMDFVLDRPFVYAVVSDTGTILFVGTVNQL